MDIMTWHETAIVDGNNEVAGARHSLMWNTVKVAQIIRLTGSMSRWYRDGQQGDCATVDEAKAVVERNVSRDMAQATGQRFAYYTAVTIT